MPTPNKWICECETHIVSTSSNRIMPGPQTFRAPGDNIVAYCPFCERPFKLAPATPVKHRRGRPCGAHCPAGSHTHE